MACAPPAARPWTRRHRRGYRPMRPSSPVIKRWMLPRWRQSSSRLITQLMISTGCDALAAVKAEEQRIEMAEKGGEPDGGEDVVVYAQPLGDEHGQQALAAVADEHDGRGLLAAEAQHIGRARLARALRARVGQAQQLAHDDGGGERADEVGGNGEQEIDNHDEQWDLRFGVSTRRRRFAFFSTSMQL